MPNLQSISDADLFSVESDRTLVIAEVGQAHDGSLGTAHSYIDAVAEAGAHAVKFQTHIAEKESSSYEPWRTKFSLQDDSRMNYWKRMEFTPMQWARLKEHAEKRGLFFLSSPFSLAAVELLEDLGIIGWKVASGELTNERLLEAMLATGKPLLLSSGMAMLEELDLAVKRCRDANAPFAVFQCTSQYPTSPERCGLNLIPEFIERYRCPVGLSDHSGTIFPSLGAVSLGAELVEVHVTFSKQAFGPDVASSVTFEELSNLVEGTRYLHKAKNHPVNKDELVETMEDIRGTFRQSLIAGEDIEEGMELTRQNISMCKPCIGIPADHFQKVMGKRTRRSFRQGEFIKFADLENGT